VVAMEPSPAWFSALNSRRSDCSHSGTLGASPVRTKLSLLLPSVSS
jgi:hypothetical protein